MIYMSIIINVHRIKVGNKLLWNSLLFKEITASDNNRWKLLQLLQNMP